MRIPLTVGAALVVALAAYLSWTGGQPAEPEVSAALSVASREAGGPAGIAPPARAEEPVDAGPPAEGKVDPEQYAADTDHHVVRPGETLASIAYWRYGARSWSTRIYQANRDQIESPDRIYPGQRLLLP